MKCGDLLYSPEDDHTQEFLERCEAAYLSEFEDPDKPYQGKAAYLSEFADPDKSEFEDPDKPYQGKAAYLSEFEDPDKPYLSEFEDLEDPDKPYQGKAAYLSEFEDPDKPYQGKAMGKKTRRARLTKMASVDGPPTSCNTREKKGNEFSYTIGHLMTSKHCAVNNVQLLSICLNEILSSVSEDGSNPNMRCSPLVSRQVSNSTALPSPTSDRKESHGNSSHLLSHRSIESNNTPQGLKSVLREGVLDRQQ